MDRKSASPKQPKPRPNPARIDDGGKPARKYQDAQPSFPENEGLVRQKNRQASDIESPEGAEIERERGAATQRGRVI